MSKDKAICILLIFVIIFMFFGWRNSENNRLALLEELNSAKDRIEELEYDLRKMR